MALSAAEQKTVEEIQAKAVELQTIIRSSLPVMNVGGGHVGNELQEIIDKAEELLASVSTTP